MDAKNEIQLFEDKRIRAAWDVINEEWLFSIVDVVQILTESKNAGAYWRKLKERLKAEGNQTVTNCHGLKMTAADGKMRFTDVANTEQLLRIIQSIPSPKAEPLKLWLAQLGRERIEEITDPEIAIDRAFQTYLNKGYSEKWINQRIKTMEVRKGLTDEWQRSGIKKSEDFATLTDIMTKEWSGKTTREYRIFKGLKKENLRDNMTNMELVLNMLAEVSATDLSKENDPCGMKETAKVAIQGGSVAKAAREQYEKQSGKKVVSPLNAKVLKELGDTNSSDGD